MSTNVKAPLLEAIFELRWGQKSAGEYEYLPEEQALFAGQISAAANHEGYSYSEMANPQLNSAFMPPMIVSHRFRKKANTWPCLQIGLGIFTVNQIHPGYDWISFKEAIKEGLDVFVKADSNKIQNNRKTLVAVLRYQDAFFPGENVPIQKYMADTFHIQANLPLTFFQHTEIKSDVNAIHVAFKIPIQQPQGIISVMIANAVINGRAGLLMETVVESEVKYMSEDINIDGLLEWTEVAHTLQLKAFKTLVKEEIYKND